MNLTPEQLKEIEERAAKATRGPWHPDGVRDVLKFVDRNFLGEWSQNEWKYDRDNDSIFISHARDDVPSLLEEVKRLQGKLTMERAAVIAIIKEWKDGGAIPDEKRYRDLAEGWYVSDAAHSLNFDKEIARLQEALIEERAAVIAYGEGLRDDWKKFPESDLYEKRARSELKKEGKI